MFLPRSRISHKKGSECSAPVLFSSNDNSIKIGLINNSFAVRGKDSAAPRTRDRASYEIYYLVPTASSKDDRHFMSMYVVQLELDTFRKVPALDVEC